jgi:uncharacterized protein (DUF362 family)/NAD-dependent dihydropyrimidine dehydrogenase PreA subunit
MKSAVSIVRCQDYSFDKISFALGRALELLKYEPAFARPGQRVLIKPNLLSARRPDEAVTTHPELLRVLVRLLKARGCKVCIGDSPGNYGRDTVEEVYKACGVKKLAQEEEVDLIKFDRIKWVDGFAISEAIEEFPLIISVPKFKTHGLTVLTGGIKNILGVVPGLYKSSLHRQAPHPDEFAKVLVRLFAIVRPALTIVDAVLAMEGDGPAAGSPRKLGLILASRDAVALDAVLARIVGLEPFRVPTIREAVQANLGEASLEQIEILGEKISDIKVKNFRLPSTSILNRIPNKVLKLTSRLWWFRPAVSTKGCNNCGACIRNCPQEAMALHNGRVEIDYTKCSLCLCCHELCPQKAIYIDKGFLAKLTGG